MTEERLPEVLALDKLCLGGLWTEDGYRREIESPNSDLLVLELSRGADKASEALGFGSLGFDSQDIGQELSNADAQPNLRQSPTATIIGLGCLWSILDEAHITTLAIHPDYHRCRLGQWLLVQLLTTAKGRQLTHATLDVRASNAAALKLYQKFEFKLAGRRKRYYADDEDALVLWLSGLQSAKFVQTIQNLSQQSAQAILQRGWRLR